MNSEYTFPEYNLTDKEWEDMFSGPTISDEVRDKIFRCKTEILSCPFCGAAEGRKGPEKNAWNGVIIRAYPMRYRNGRKHILYMIACSCGAIMGRRLYNIPDRSPGYFPKLEDCIKAWNNQAGFQAESREKIAEPLHGFYEIPFYDLHSAKNTDQNKQEVKKK